SPTTRRSSAPASAISSPASLRTWRPRCGERADESAAERGTSYRVDVAAGWRRHDFGDPRPLGGSMKVLVTNDDGVASPGLHALARALVDNGFDLIVGAPDRETRASAGAH